MNAIPKALMVVTAVVALLAALLGLWYNGTTMLIAIRGGFSKTIKEPGLSHFYPAFYTMSAICVVCYLLLLACGIALLRSRVRWSQLLTGVLIFEVVYVFVVAALWMAPTIGRSVAAATGLANGGLMAQFIILFPLWAPLALWWAGRRLESDTYAA
jgi:hypothetical protein